MLWLVAQGQKQPADASVLIRRAPLAGMLAPPVLALEAGSCAIVLWLERLVPLRRGNNRHATGSAQGAQN
jgi:hypothetical protein